LEVYGSHLLRSARSSDDGGGGGGIVSRVVVCPFKLKGSGFKVEMFRV
jgi:hypothetical protein